MCMILRICIGLMIFTLSCIKCADFMPVSQHSSWSINQHSGSREVSANLKMELYEHEKFGVFSNSTGNLMTVESSSKSPSCPDGYFMCKKQRYSGRKLLQNINPGALTGCSPNKILTSTGKCIIEAKFSKRFNRKSKRKYNSEMARQAVKIN
ncbi:hypothetical protein CHUAL_002099 [Chamberlinius hualienensis]